MVETNTVKEKKIVFNDTKKFQTNDWRIRTFVIQNGAKVTTQ